MVSSVLILLVLLTVSSDGLERSKRALNGTKTVHTVDFGSFVKEYPYAIDYPWMIELLTTGGHLCGGALIRPNFALTARHCFPKNINDMKDVSRYKLLAGNQIYEDQESEFVQMRQVEKVVAYPGQGLFNDLAIIKVMEPFTLNLHANFVNMAPQSKTHDYLNQTVVLTGWGSTGTKSHSDYLLKVYGLIIECDLPETVLCFRCLGGKPQGGDSGAPAVIKGEMGKPDLLIGIFPAGYTKDVSTAINLAYFSDWINENIAKM